MTTADKIRELIEEKGLTQRQFAELEIKKRLNSLVSTC